jgi:hypothetical protein
MDMKFDNEIWESANQQFSRATNNNNQLCLGGGGCTKLSKINRVIINNKISEAINNRGTEEGRNKKFGG